MTAPLPTALVELAGGPIIAHVATVLPDGAPHVVPVWIDTVDDALCVLTSPRSRKARNLAQDGRIAVSLVDPARPTRMTSVRGHVLRCIDGDDAWPIIDRMSVKYTGGPFPLRSDRVVFVIAVDRVATTDFG